MLSEPKNVPLIFYKIRVLLNLPVGAEMKTNMHIFRWLSYIDAYILNPFSLCQSTEFELKGKINVLKTPLNENARNGTTPAKLIMHQHKVSLNTEY
jgi:hypothetical protein